MVGKEIVGIEQKKGTFTAEDGRVIDYDNVYLHLLGQNDNVNGSAVSVLKVKSELADGLQVGDNIVPIYDVSKSGAPFLSTIEVINE